MFNLGKTTWLNKNSVYFEVNQRGTCSTKVEVASSTSGRKLEKCFLRYITREKLELICLLYLKY